MNVHTPQRGPNETREQYIERRKASHVINAMNGKPKNWRPTTRVPGSMATSRLLNALLTGDPLPKVKKQRGRLSRLELSRRQG